MYHKLRLAGASLAASAALLAIGGTVAGGWAQEDKPIDVTNPEAQEVESLTKDLFPVQISGFMVGNYTYDGRTNENNFAASKIAVSLFTELSEHLWVFGQLTTLLEEPEEGSSTSENGGDQVTTTTEIDNFIVNFTPPGVPGLSFSFGKFDSPLGFERDDEPLNLQPTTGFNLELARPIKMVGLVSRWNATPKIDVLAMVTNGWESEVDPNHGKTIGARIGFLPTRNTSFGVGGTFGPEGEQGNTQNRYLLSFDYALQPSDNFVIAGEVNYGGDDDAAEDGSDANWFGGSLTAFGRLAPRFGLTARAEVFDDADGARTGEDQTIQSFSLVPAFFFGVGQEGIFTNIEHTTFRIPRFQLRGEIRVDRSGVDFFETSNGLDNWDIRYIVQLVTVF